MCPNTTINSGFFLHDVAILTTFVIRIQITMRVLIINTSEKTGGAAVASNRLMNALNNNGVKARMLVRDKETDEITVSPIGHPWQAKWAFLWERLCIFFHLHFNRKHLFEIDIANAGIDVTNSRYFKEADVIHLEWINQGMLSLKGIRKILNSGKPVVWTMHDLWPATAICHYTNGCNNFHEECGNCPLLPHNGSNNDLSHKVWKKKEKGIKGKNINIVAVSNWVAKQAHESSLLANQPIHVIGNSLSLPNFPMYNYNKSLFELGLSDKRVIVFGAARIDTPIKGFHFLKEALKILVKEKPDVMSNIQLILFGDLKDKNTLNDIPLSYKWLGKIDSEELPKIYSAASVVVNSSYYETFGQTLSEAMACGAIPVTFDNSGQCDIVDHLKNGYLAHYKDTNDLAKGIDWALNANIDRESQREDVASKFSDGVIARKYIALYEQISHKTI